MALIMLFAIKSYSQDFTLADSLLNIYSNEALPFFVKLSKKNLPDIKDKETNALVESKYAVLKVNLLVIKKQIKEAIVKSDKIKLEKQDLIKLIDLEYQKYYPELPKEFWNKVLEKTKDL
ncbi:MAG TPA: hypothetical protein DIW31_05660 [Bacteroidales bacterium]|nr:hypothetical protein [Bacteroidales bacterium]